MTRENDVAGAGLSDFLPRIHTKKSIKTGHSFWATQKDWWLNLTTTQRLTNSANSTHAYDRCCYLEFHHVTPVHLRTGHWGCTTIAAYNGNNRCHSTGSPFPKRPAEDGLPATDNTGRSCGNFGRSGPPLCAGREVTKP